MELMRREGPVSLCPISGSPRMKPTHGENLATIYPTLLPKKAQAAVVATVDCSGKLGPEKAFSETGREPLHKLEYT